MDPSRQPLIAANWKMNAGGADGCDLAAGVARAAAELPDVDVVVAPPFTALAAVSHQLSETKSTVAVAAQNMHHEASGAFTGLVGFWRRPFRAWLALVAPAWAAEMC